VGVGVGVEVGFEDGVTGGGVGVVICANVCSGFTTIRLDTVKMTISSRTARLLILFPTINGSVSVIKAFSSTFLD